MKKIRLLFLLLLPFLAISQVVPADASQFENIQMTNNATSATAAKVVVQESNGVLNTIAKTDLQNVIEVASASALPATGAAGVIYVTLDNQLQYRWTGAIYNPYFQSKANLSGATFTGPVVVPTATLATQAVNKAQLDILTHVGPTGLNEGAVMSINTDTAKYDLSAGFGYVVNGHSDPDNPTYTKVTWTAKIANVIPNLATQEITYIAIDINGDLFPTNAPLTATQRRDYIRIGRIIHLNNTSITYINNQPTVNIEVGGQVQDILEALGFRSLSGNRVFPVSTNLKIKKEVGKVFKSGANFENLTTQPHSFTLPELNPITFKYRTQTGAEGASITDIDPDIYDVNGTVTPVGSTATLATIQRIFVSQSNEVRIQPGQRVFTTLNGAVTAINSDVFVTDSDIFDNFLYLGAIVLTRNTVNLADIAQAIFVPSIGVCANGAAPVVGNFIQNGTTNTLVKFTGSATVGNSLISESGNIVSVISSADAVDGFKISAPSGKLRLGGFINESIGAVISSVNNAETLTKNLSINSTELKVNSPLSVTGAATFSSSVTTTNGSFASVKFAQTALFRNNGAYITLASNNGTTGEKLLIDLFAPDNSLLISNSGAATFASSVTAATLVSTGVTVVGSLSGTGTRNVQVDANGTLISAAGYKVYTALLSQSGTAAPVATVLENTLGGTVVFSRNSAGLYLGTLSGAFIVDKTVVFFQSGKDVSGSLFTYYAHRQDNNSIRLQAQSNGVYSDINSVGQIELRVYNFIFLMVPYSMTRRKKKKLKKIK